MNITWIANPGGIIGEHYTEIDTGPKGIGKVRFTLYGDGSRWTLVTPNNGVIALDAINQRTAMIAASAEIKEWA